nr:adipogenesis regulatory factor isoform X1 [Chelonoidis abingdonii]
MHSLSLFSINNLLIYSHHGLQPVKHTAEATVITLHGLWCGEYGKREEENVIVNRLNALFFLITANALGKSAQQVVNQATDACQKGIDQACKTAQEGVEKTTGQASEAVSGLGKKIGLKK